MAAFVVGWLLVGSTLLWLTWNKVIAAHAKVKAAKFWQALLLLTTVLVLCGPKYLARHHDKGGCCDHSSKCPYSAPDKPEAKAK